MNVQQKQPRDKNARDEGLRKVAILVSSLDRRSADAMLDALDAEQAQQVRRTMLDLGPIDPKEQRRVIDEFSCTGPVLRGQGTPGIESDVNPSRNRSVPETYTPPTAPPSVPAADGRPFRFLHGAEADKLSRILSGERPQTIALVLSHLSPDRAGKVLACLQGALQVEVIHRLVDLEETDPEILREVEGALQSRLSQQVPMQRRRVAGVQAVTDILQASESRVGIDILENLAAHDRSLAERLSPRTIQFGDLLQLDDAELRAVFQAAGSELTMTALVGAPPELIDRILRRLPASEAESVRRQLDHPGPIRLSDVEAARQEIADAARMLSMEGRIRLPHSQAVSLS